MITMSAEMGEMFVALAKAQGSIKDAKMDKENPHFRSKYASLSSVHDAIKAELSKNGIAVSQHCHSADGKSVTIITLLGHSSGQWMQSSLTMPLDKVTPQGMGSAITYGRRYALAAVVGIASDEDDDGNVAERQAPAPQQRQQSAPPRQAPQQQAKPQQTVPAAHNPNAIFVFPAGKYKGRDIASLTHDELRGWYHYFADKTAPGETQKGWVGEGMAIARKILDRDKEGFANEVPGNNDFAPAPTDLDYIPF